MKRHVYRVLSVSAVVAILVATSILGLKAWRQQGKAKPNGKLESQLSLRAQVDGEMLRIAWDPNAPSLRQASNGVLTIRDGSFLRNISLTSNELRSRDSISYAPSTNEVELKLEISGARIPKQTQSVMVVLGPAQAAPASPKPPIEAVTEDDSSFVEPVQKPLEASSQPQLKQTVSISQQAGEGINHQVYRPPIATAEVKPVIPRELEPLVLEAVEINVHVRIDARGRVVRARPVSQTGSLAGSTEQRTQITHSVVDAARRWSFRPAQINSRTVPSELILTFRLAKNG